MIDKISKLPLTINSTKLSFPVKNPATGEVLCEVPDLGAAGAKAAIAQAYSALSNWSSTAPKMRGETLYAWYELIRRDTEILAELLTMEQGKPLKESRAEIEYGAAYIKFYAEEATRLIGEVLPSPNSGKKIFVIREPVGVSAAITPWNFPNAMIARKAAPALAAGCTFIVKPAPETPLSALALWSLALEAGLPKGALLVVTGKAEPIASELMSSNLVRKISFTGSTEVGKILMRQSADTVKRITLELGGNAPFIVFEDANIEASVTGAIAAKFRNGGQSCIGINRILLHTSIADKFKVEFIRATQNLKVGNGFDSNSDIGPLINGDAVSKVVALVDDAISKGAKIEFGIIPKCGSNFVAPLVLSGITNKMRISSEEIFGPIAAIQTFKDEAEAIHLANDTSYGLAAYIYSQNMSRLFRVSDALEFGMIGMNDVRISAAEVPFGGLKESGFGREGSRHGIEEYTQLKYLSLGGL